MPFRPKSPNERSEPRHALPHMRPRCCFRYLTLFGINITKPSQHLSGQRLSTLCLRLEHACCRSRLTLLAALALLVDVPTVDPGLHPDNPVGGVRLGKSIIDIGTKRMQRQPALQVPLRAGNLVPVQTSRYPNLDALAAKPQRGVDAL